MRKMDMMHVSELYIDNDLLGAFGRNFIKRNQKVLPSNINISLMPDEVFKDDIAPDKKLVNELDGNLLHIGIDFLSGYMNFLSKVIDEYTLLDDGSHDSKLTDNLDLTIATAKNKPLVIRLNEKDTKNILVEIYIAPRIDEASQCEYHYKPTAPSLPSVSMVGKS